jgi:hypothetical protein
MTDIKAHRFLLPLLIAGAFIMPGPVLAQDQPPPAPKPAAKPKPKPKPKPPADAQAAPNLVAQATMLGQFGDWGAYTATPDGRKVCFALAKPTSSLDNPPNRRSASSAVYMFISTRPSEKVRDEISILVAGYEFKPSADASLAIGSTNFVMYTQKDGAWVKNPGDEGRLVDSIRKNPELTIKAMTSKGTQTTDRFSLKGIAQALDRVAQECSQ